MLPSLPVENPELLEELMKKGRFAGSSTRLNVASNSETYIHKNGRAFLKERVMSDVVRQGPIFEEVKKTPPLGGATDAEQKSSVYKTCRQK